MPFRGVGFSRMDEKGNEIASLCISTLPGRKQVALYIQRGVTATVLAYFLNEQAAQEMVEILKTMVKRRRRHDTGSG